MAIQCKEFVSELPLAPGLSVLNASSGRALMQRLASPTSRMACCMHTSQDQPAPMQPASQEARNDGKTLDTQSCGRKYSLTGVYGIC